MAIGPRAQEVIRPFLKLDLQAYLFSPKDGVEAKRTTMRQQRKSKVQPSQRSRRKRNAKRQPGDRYSVAAYYRVIRMACKRAGLPHWHPHQLRHTAATRLRREYNLDTARAVLGHRTPVITELYAELDVSRAAEVMERRLSIEKEMEALAGQPTPVHLFDRTLAMLLLEYILQSRVFINDMFRAFDARDGPEAVRVSQNLYRWLQGRLKEKSALLVEYYKMIDKNDKIDDLIYQACEYAADTSWDEGRKSRNVKKRYSERDATIVRLKDSDTDRSFQKIALKDINEKWCGKNGKDLTAKAVERAYHRLKAQQKS